MNRRGSWAERTKAPAGSGGRYCTPEEYRRQQECEAYCVWYGLGARELGPSLPRRSAKARRRAKAGYAWAAMLKRTIAARSSVIAYSAACLAATMIVSAGQPPASTTRPLEPF